MRIELIATVQAVLGVHRRLPSADEVIRRFLLATAGTDDENHVISNRLKRRLRSHYLMLRGIMACLVEDICSPCDAKCKQTQAVTM